MKNFFDKHWKARIYKIIYHSDTPAGKLFDLVLLVVILASILLVMLESVNSIDKKYHDFLNIAEWIITILFTIEYILRIITNSSPKKYIFSFYGIIDLLSTVPKYLSFFLVGSHSLVALRALRLMRVFRILKLARFMGESNNFIKALKASRVKIAVFVSFVVILCIILGTVMYLVESEQDSGFTSIPRSVYWAIVTLTTVGYGDIAPVTSLGQFIASLIMIIGYGIIAVPTGIVTAEFANQKKEPKKEKDLIPDTKTCPECLTNDIRKEAKYCYVCGAEIVH
ncbi:ion transporter [Flaviramulus sp. BrNp1-15]|uniref:ion transporter n=1 Tax=Flaviramulus sp. BrNp1-15 TaxID=2916754 RepID=UPI001EE94A51|nr:ion transporter [Flaviramulus sp. BrNp1-15]ULC58539.1 ion transporter [Flaviramulus sp. BrNp1-15]